MSIVAESAPSRKTCTKCGIEKALEDFPAYKNRVMRGAHCRGCVNARAREKWAEGRRPGVPAFAPTIRKTCRHCGAESVFAGVVGGAAKFCSLRCALLARTIVGEVSACWPWSGGTDAYGYGSFTFGNQVRKAHRVSLELKLDRLLEETECACHDCDNPVCVNPSHLRVGTRGENVAEAHAKGRASKPPRNDHRGERSPHALFSEADVVSMRARFDAGESARSIASSIAAKQGTVRAIVERRTWKHLP